MSFKISVSQLLYDGAGARKYLSIPELQRFGVQCDEADRATRLFCLLLLFTGCRVSEALGVTPLQIDEDLQSVVLRTLKQRRPHFRSVPLPEWLVKELMDFACNRPRDARLWTWTRQTAWRRVKAVMALVKITGAHATPKGLRHGYGIANAQVKIPPGTTQTWMGHVDLETTKIYQQAMGAEERALANNLWAVLSARHRPAVVPRNRRHLDRRMCVGGCRQSDL